MLWIRMVASLTLVIVPAAVWAQHSDHGAIAANPHRLGVVQFPNSGNFAAQAPFIEGVKLLHNFDYPGAQAAFREAQRADPDMVLAYWGEAMAHNETLWSEQTRDEALNVLAKLAPTREARAAKAGSPRERAWLDAVETLYGDGTKFERDILYADKMDALARDYPDTEAIVFDALATLGRSHGTRDFANYAKAGAMLLPLFATHPDHPGIAHYIIHSYDDPANAAKGLAAAEAYGKLAPDSPHAQHMVSHIYLALGMWPEIEKANINATEAVIRLRGGDRRNLACGHAGLWLAYARLQQGKDVASQLADCKWAAEHDLADNKDAPTIGYPEATAASAAEIAVRRGIETGQWDTPIALPPGKLNYARFLYLYGGVLSARRDPVRARSALEGLRAAHDILTKYYGKEYPDDDQTMPWLDLATAEAEAVVMLAEGQGAGLDALRAVAAREKAMSPPFGPPVLLKPSWEMLGDELLAMGDKKGAAEAYRQSLALQPGRRLSLAGLKAATQ